MKRNRKRRRRHGDRIPRRVWIWTLCWLVLAVAAIACSHRLAPLTEPTPPTDTLFVSDKPERPEKPETPDSPAEPAEPTELVEPVAPGKPVLPAGLELPALGATDTAIYNEEGRYTFLYCPSGKVSRWVAYKLTQSDMTGAADRSDAFRPDPRIAIFGWPTATSADYRGSGYDRGHLLPSADRTCSAAANRATFFYSNMAPQLPKLNRGAWKSLEERLRDLTRDYDTLYIVVGTVLGERPSRIGSGVAVPALFFKAVALRRGAAFEGVAYVMPNDGEGLANKHFSDFEVSVDSVERLTNLDLFPNIPAF